MFDDVQRLRDHPHLAELLAHYAHPGKIDRAAWQDRLMHIDGLKKDELSKLHGELIAFDWIEQNTGQASLGADGVISQCYRITSNGLRDLARYLGEEFVELPPEPEEKANLPFKRKKKPKASAPEAAAYVTTE